MVNIDWGRQLKYQRLQISLLLVKENVKYLPEIKLLVSNKYFKDKFLKLDILSNFDVAVILD